MRTAVMVLAVLLAVALWTITFLARRLGRAERDLSESRLSYARGLAAGYARAAATEMSRAVGRLFGVG